MAMVWTMIRSISDMTLPLANAILVIDESIVTISSWFGRLVRDEGGETGGAK